MILSIANWPVSGTSAQKNVTNDIKVELKSTFMIYGSDPGLEDRMNEYVMTLPETVRESLEWEVMRNGGMVPETEG